MSGPPVESIGDNADPVLNPTTQGERTFQQLVRVGSALSPTRVAMISWLPFSLSKRARLAALGPLEILGRRRPCTEECLCRRTRGSLWDCSLRSCSGTLCSREAMHVLSGKAGHHDGHPWQHPRGSLSSSVLGTRRLRTLTRRSLFWCGMGAVRGVDEFLVIDALPYSRAPGRKMAMACLAFWRGARHLRCKVVPSDFRLLYLSVLAHVFKGCCFIKRCATRSRIRGRT